MAPIVESFLIRYRRGERPSLDEYADRYPELADQIRELLPALAEIEGLDGVPVSETDPVPRTPATPESVASIPDHLGDYRILRKIGEGGMGVVYEAVRESLKSRVALKVMHPRYRQESAYLKRFRLEARSAAGLHHTNIVSVFDFGEESGVCYYAMQYIAGVGLDRVLEDVRRLRRAPAAEGDDTTADAPHPDRETVVRGLMSGRYVPPDVGLAPTLEGGPPGDASTRTAPPRPPSSDCPAEASADVGGSSHALTGSGEIRYFKEVARLVAQVADALAYAHDRKVLHRDIKPSNLLLDARGNAWVTDFGLAKFEEGEDVSHSRDVVGTLRYMAPERFEGISSRPADIYALGATLYELLALRPAFDAKEQVRLIQSITQEAPPPLRQLDRNIPRDLATIAHKAMAREPKDRFATASDLAAELRRFVEGRPIRSRRVGPLEHAWRWGRRNPVVAGLGAAVALLAFAGIAGLAYGYRESRRALETETELHAEADRRAEEARAITTFLTTLLDQATEPRYAQGRAVKVEDLMAKADEMLAEGPFEDRPLVEAELRSTIGKIYHRLKLAAAATPHLRRAWQIRAEQLGPSHPDTLLSQVDYAWSLDGTLRFDESQRQIERCWQLTQRRFGPGHPTTRRVVQSYLQLSFSHGSGDRREHLALMEDALRAISRSSSEDKEAEAWESTFLKLKMLFLRSEGRLAEARKLADNLHSRPMRADGGTEFDASIDLAEIEFALGEWGQAESRMRRALEACEPLYAAEHWTIVMPLALLVRVAKERGEWTRARELLESWSVSTDFWGASRAIERAEIAALRGDLDAARDLRDEWSILSRRAGHPEEEYLRGAAEGVGWFYPQFVAAARVDVLCGNPARSRGMCERLQKYGLPEPSLGTARFGPWPLNDLARTLATSPETRDQPEDVARAHALAEMIVAAQPEIGFFKTTLGIARYRAGDLAGAIDALTSAERLRRDENTAATHGFYLAMAHHRLGRVAEARSWFDRAVDWMDAHRPGDPGLVSLRAEAEARLQPARLDAAFPADPFAP